MTNRFLVSCFLCVLICAPLPAEIPQDRFQKVDHIFAEYDRTQSPGCAVGVIHQGSFVYKRGYGMANLEWGIANGSRTVFRIGSTAKQFTAAAVALLDRQGKLSLDDEIQKFLPEIPRYEKPVTIRHLIHHTSGLRDYLSLSSLAGLRRDDFYTDDEALELLARQKELNFQPGERHLYSNTNYLLLAHIVERASGRNLRRFAEDEIFKPLGMDDTHFHNNHNHIVPNRAAGYRKTEDGRYEISQTTLDMIGDGGVFTTVEDLLKWDRNFYEDRLGVVETLLTQGKLNDGTELDYAFGLDVSSHRGLKTVRHGGAFVGFRAEMLRFPEERFTVICLCNRADASPSRLAVEAAEVFLADRLDPEPAPIAEPAAEDQTIDPALLDDYLGSYQIQPDLILEILRDGDRLFGEPDGQERRELVPAGSDRFRVDGLGAHLLFEREADGGVKGLVLDFGTRQTPAPRVISRQLEAEALLPFVGTYFSDELQIDYVLQVRDGRLVVVVRRNPPTPLTLRQGDKGGFDLGTIQFERSQNGEVTGFVLQAGRVKNLRFVRRAK